MLNHHRLFIPESLEIDQQLTLPQDKAHYIQRVLRLPEQSPVWLFNGQGGAYRATVHHQGKKVLARIHEFDPTERELGLKINVAQGLATGDKMDWVIEKAVEMGVFAFAPIAAQRSVLKLAPARMEKRVAHWQRIIEAASAQCGRNRLMRLDPPKNLEDYLRDQREQLQAPGQGLILCHQDATHDFVQAFAPPVGGWSQLHLLIGPEGGWSDEEVACALDYGARPLLFGQRVLRTETAAIALVGALRGYLHCLD